MPIYDYRCTECDATFEIFHREDPVTEKVSCPECQSLDIRKLVSVSNFHLKGTGWYKTDYSDNSKSKKSGD